MTHGDRKFMMEVGIEPCTLDDPFPHSFPPLLPPGPVIPSLTEKDACWLLNLGVRWEPEPEPDFMPPKSLQEYLARYPHGIREAAGEAAKRLGLDLSNDDLNDLGQDIVVMFLDSSTDLEDVVKMYATCLPPRPGKCRSAHFHHYIKFRVRAALRTLLRNREPDGC